jgi:cobalamin synthase
VSAIFFDLALKAALWTVLMQQGKGGVVMASCILSRSMQALSVSFFPRARSTGTTACYPTSKGARAAAVAGLLISLAAVLALTDVVFTAVLGAAALFTWIILCSYFLRRISGITGDCIGAVNECCELGALAAGLMVVTFM